MPTHYAEPIIDYWVDEVNRGVKKAKQRNIIFLVNLIFLLLVSYFSNSQILKWFAIYFANTFILISAFKLFKQQKISKKFKKVRLKSIKSFVPYEFRIFHQKLVHRFNISDFSIRLYADYESTSNNIELKYFQQKYHLIIPKYFFDLLKIEPENCEEIYARRLNDIYQKNIENLFKQNYVIKLILLIFILIDLILFLISYGLSMEIFVFYSAILPVLLCYYIFFERSKMFKRLKERKLKVIYNDVPLLTTLHKDLLAKFNINSSCVQLLLDSSNKVGNIYCNYFQKKYHLIIPLGFLGLVKKDFKSAKIIYAHELSHIRQRDPVNLIEQKFLAKGSVFLIQIPTITITLFALVYYTLNTDLLVSYSINAFSTLFSTAYSTLNAKKKAFDSERNADIGTAMLYGTGNLENCLNKYSKELTFYKKVLIWAPSLGWRLTELNTLKKYFPELILIKDEKDSILPNLDELR